MKLGELKRGLGPRHDLQCSAGSTSRDVFALRCRGNVSHPPSEDQDLVEPTSAG